MKDVLLKILNTQITAYKEEPVNHHNHPEFVNVIIDGFENATTEIANIVKDFEKWKHDNVGYNYDYQGKKYTYNKLFIYWYNEIREK